MPTYSYRSIKKERKQQLLAECGEDGKAFAKKIDKHEEVEEKCAPPYWRPSTYGECVELPRPCPFVACKYHLWLDTDSHTGSYKTVDREIENMKETCALDVARRGGVTLEDVANLLGVSRERIRQVENVALNKLQSTSKGRPFEQFKDSTMQDSGSSLSHFQDEASQQLVQIKRPRKARLDV